MGISVRSIASWLPAVAVLTAAALTGFAEMAFAAEPVVAQLRDGRLLRGGLDAATDADRLWLLSTEPGIVLRSSFPWDQVAGVQVGGRVATPDEARILAARAAAAGDDGPTVNGPGGVSPPSPGPPLVNVSTCELCQATEAGADTSRVRSLHMDAHVANWDDDPETDGLRVYVRPLDADGQVVAVSGTLDMQLVGQVRELAAREAEFPEIGRWSRLVQATDFGRSGAVYELPFQTIHPEFRLDLAGEGIASARLGVSGRGVLEASAGRVILRPASRIRDELQLHTGRRFLDAEGTQWRTPTRWSR